MTGSLCCEVEISTKLCINYILIKKKKLGVGNPFPPGFEYVQPL